MICYCATKLRFIRQQAKKSAIFIKLKASDESEKRKVSDESEKRKENSEKSKCQVSRQYQQDI